MTLTQCRRLEAGMYVFYQSAIWRVATPPLVRRRDGTKVRIEAASGTSGDPLEVTPDALQPFGKLRRATAANQLLADRLRSLVAMQRRGAS